MPRAARSLLIATALAVAGAYLAADAWWHSSLVRYLLCGLVLGALLMLPLLTLLLFGERARCTWRKLLFAMLPLLALLLLAEVTVRLFADPREAPAVLRADARLGHVVAPGTAGTDARGWRNAAAAERCDALFVGDSQTWGFGVARDEAFPQRFAAAGDEACYQMATGSYGPVQYVELVRRGLQLQPQLVVVAFYFGNDLVDAADYAGLEGAEALRTDGVRYDVRDNPELRGKRSPNVAMTLIDGALALSQLLDAAANVVKSRLRGGLLDRQPGAVPFDDDDAPTILLPAYREHALDLDNPNVADGARVTARCLQAIAALCRDAGAACVVLAIPTKEFTYAEWQGDAVPELRELAARERRARERVFAAVAAADLELVDLTGALVDALRGGEQPWFRSGDGHLAARGHELAAAALAGARGR